jgi:hypothetical protein
MTGFWIEVRKRIAALVVGTLALAHISVLLVATPALAAPSTSLVVDEVMLSKSGSGNTTKEFVDLYNKSADKKDVSGWQVKKVTGAGSLSTLFTFPSSPAPIVNGHDFLLLAHKDYTTIPSKPDFTYSSDSLASNSSIIIADSTGSVIDSVRMGSGTLPEGYTPEGAAIANPVNDESISRNANHDDTDDNSADFSEHTTPSPKSGKPTTPILNPIVTGDKSLTVSWAEVRNAENYTITYKETNSDDVKNAGTTSSTSKKIIGLKNGTNYTISVVAKNDNGESVAANQTGTPSLIVDAFITFNEGETTGFLFGPGIVTATVDFQSDNDVDQSDVPTISFARPSSSVVTGPLKYDATKHRWIASLAVTKAVNPSQDGNVAVSLNTNTSGKSINIKSGAGFTVDTMVNKPSAQVVSRCSTAQDSFTAAISDSDVEYIYIYKSANLSDRIAVAPVHNGKTDEVFIGDNKMEKLYLVAQDKVGNISEPLEIKNPLSIAKPTLKLEGGNGVIKASWQSVGDNTNYTLRWRPVGQSNWQEKSTTSTNNDISVPNDKEHEVMVLAKDNACNQNSSDTMRATAHSTKLMNVSNKSTANREAMILASAHLTGSKDGQLNEGTGTTGKGAGTTEGSKTEGQPGNQVTSTPTPGPTSSATESPSPGGANFFKDRSKLIITLAIILIIAGTALAAYSWYKGDETSPTDDDTESNGDDSTDEEDESEEEEDSDDSGPPKSGRNTKPRRRTRW